MMNEKPSTPLPQSLFCAVSFNDASPSEPRAPAGASPSEPRAPPGEPEDATSRSRGPPWESPLSLGLPSCLPVPYPLEPTS